VSERCNEERTPGGARCEAAKGHDGPHNGNDGQYIYAWATEPPDMAAPHLPIRALFAAVQIDALEHARQQERARIVEWLRAEATGDDVRSDEACACARVADAIERGEHEAP
jgi:hypothetical protein